MAQTIIAPNIDLYGVDWSNMPGNRFTAADQTATTSLITFISPVRNVRALVWLKAYTKSSGTIGPIFQIKVADNSGFSTNVRAIATGIANDASATGQLGCLTLMGTVPDNFLAAWCKIFVTFSASDSGTFDVVVDAV